MSRINIAPLTGRMFSFFIKIKYIQFSVLMLILISCITTSAQQTPKSTPLIESLTNHTKKFRQEKVHLHLDKSVYAAGDTIYLAGYIVNAVKNIPSELSKVLYIELVGNGQEILKSTKNQITAGFTSASISLPDTLREGAYQVRAYTNWMRNFDNRFFFTQEISILSSDITTRTLNSKQQIPPVQDIAKENIANTYEIGFYPEGGQLVNGLESRVGFKAVDRQGNGISVKGIVLDGSGKRMADFVSGHAGLGMFKLKPEYSQTYIAAVTFPDGSTQEIKLPAVAHSGYVLNADNASPDTLNITIQTTADLVKKRKMTFLPIANGVPLFFMETDLPDQQVHISVPKSKLPGGIIQLSLINDLYQPVSERLVFNKYLESVNLNVSGLKPIYKKGDDVVLELDAKDQLGKPVIGSFSVSVTQSVDPDWQNTDEPDLLNNILLSSDLKGYIEQPAYYFKVISSQKEVELDNLMLTQSWTRFSWQEIRNPELIAAKFAAEQKISIRGRIKNASPRVKLANISITLLAGELGNGIVLDTITNDQGQFTFELPDSMGYLPIRIQAKPKNSATYTITLDQESLPEINPDNFLWSEKETWIAALKQTKTYAAYISKLKLSGQKGFNFKGTNQLKNVVVRDYNPRPKLVNSHSANLNGPGAADHVMLAEDLAKMPQLEYLAGMMPFKIGGGRGDGRYVLNSNNGLPLPGILILVDGVAGIDKLNDLAPTQIESVELLKNPEYTGIYGIRGAGGVLLITTKQGKFDTSSLNKPAPNTIFLPGMFTLQKQFFHSGMAKENKSIQFVETVFWKPDIITDREGRATVRFTSPGLLPGYMIKIEGVGVKGNLLSKQIP